MERATRGVRLDARKRRNVVRHGRACLSRNVERVKMFRDLLFIQGEEASPLLDLLDARGAADVLDYLAESDAFNWHGELADALRYGARDNVEQVERFHVISNPRLQYIGVEYFHFSSELERSAEHGNA